MTTAIRYQRHPAVEAAPMHDEVVLYDPGANRFCLLNGTAAFLWDQLAEPRTAEELSAALCGRYAGVDSATAAQDVRSTLARFDELAVVSRTP